MSAVGSVASILALPRKVCFTPLSDDKADMATGQFRAIRVKRTKQQTFAVSDDPTYGTGC